MNIKKWYRDYERDLSLKSNSINTRKTYTSLVWRFLVHFKAEVEPKAIHNDRIKDYLLSFNTFNTRKQNLCALRSFYSITVKMPNKITQIPYPKKAHKLPKVLDKQFILENIKKIKNLKHKAIISLTFSVGLRVSEILNLQVEDIDSKRKLISIRNAKGMKDRYVPLSDHILQLLRQYYKAYKPKEFLFNGQNGGKYTATSCNAIVKKHLGDKSHVHLLRHSCFTTMLESGVDISVIQKIAGHKNIKTTQIYTHVSNNFLSKVQTPI